MFCSRQTSLCAVEVVFARAPNTGMAVEGLFEGEKRLYSMNKSTREFNYINSFDLIIYANMILDIALKDYCIWGIYLSLVLLIEIGFAKMTV